MTETPPPIRTIPFRFTGDSLEYFRIWIVNIFLTIITLGIYSAWAKVRTLRYFYGNTRLDNNSFSYLAEPLQILKGRLIAVTVLFVYYFTWEIYPQAGFWFLALGVLLLPAIMVMALSFNMHNSAYRGIRFAFRKDFRKIYSMFLAPILILLALTWLGYSLSAEFILTPEMQENGQLKQEDLLPLCFMLSVFPVLPYLVFLRTRFLIDQTRYGKSQARFAAGAWEFYKIYLLACLLFAAIVIALGIGFLILGFILGVIIAVTVGNNAEEVINKLAWLIMTIPFAIAVYGSWFFISGYMRAAQTNMTFNNAYFGQDTFHSKLKAMPVSWLYISNTVAIIGSAGLLIPWAKIRMARYVADNTAFKTRTLDNIEATPESTQSAVGEEVGDAFDLDLGL